MSQPMLNTGNEGQARLVYSPDARVTDRPVPTENHLDPNSDENLKKLRWRVAYLALAMGGLAVFHHVCMYFAGVAEVESLLAQAKKMKIMAPHINERMTGFITHGFGRLASVIAMSMAIPCCGYYGVKEHDARLLGCFCGCNALFTCGAILVLIASSAALVFLENIEPQIEPWLERCDPKVCRDLGATNKTVDCLAGMGRTPIFEDIPHLPAPCPQAFLKCSVAESDPCMFPIEGQTCPDTERVAFCEDSWRDGECSMKGRISGRCEFDDVFTGWCLPVGLPTDPAKSCFPDSEKMVSYQDVAHMIPMIAPKIATLVVLKIFLTIPATILGCLGVWWGWALFDKVRAGYAWVPEPRFGLQNINPQPATLQREQVRSGEVVQPAGLRATDQSNIAV